MSHPRNEILTRLLTYIPGQKSQIESVADEAIEWPEFTEEIFNGKYPAGVEAALSQVSDNFKQNSKHFSEWIFLIGAPGNGKSKAARNFVNKLLDGSIEKVSENPRSSSYTAVADDRRVLVINDASIPREASDCFGSLYSDILESAEYFDRTKSFLFGNVNRGILLQELNALNESEGSFEGYYEGFAKLVIEWLSNPKEVPNHNPDLKPKICDGARWSGNTSYYSRLDLDEGVVPVRIHAVFLDTLSLLEPSPSLSFDQGDDPFKEQYITFGSVGQPNVSRNATLAAETISKLVDGSLWDEETCVQKNENGQSIPCEAMQICPFYQNAAWLRHEKLKENFLSVIRACEVASGKRFTYTDLWAYLVTALVGNPNESWLHIDEPVHPCDWVFSKLDETLAPESEESLVELFTHRIYISIFQTLFDIQLPFGNRLKNDPNMKFHGALADFSQNPESKHRSPHFDVGFDLIDPAKDASKASFWTEDISDAVEGVIVLGNTSETLLEIPDMQPLTATFGVLERLVDKSLAKSLLTLKEDNYNNSSNSSANRRRSSALLQWRYITLARHVGLANCNIRFKQPVMDWLDTQRRALVDENGTLNGPINLGLKRLIGVASLDDNGEPALLLDPLRPRTIPIVKDGGHTFMVRIVGTVFNVTCQAEGEQLFAKVIFAHPDQNFDVPSFPINLDIAREATNRSGQQDGFTEIKLSSFARIERARAKMLLRSKNVGSTKLLVLDENGREFLIEKSLGQSQTQYSVTGD